MCRWFGQNNYCPGLWKVAQRIKNHPIWSHCMEPINCWFCLIDILLICSASPSYKTLNLICVQFLLCLLPGLSSSESKKQAVQGFELTTSTGSNLFYYLNLRNEMEEATRELLVAVGQVLTSEIRSRIPSSRVSSIPLTPTRLILSTRWRDPRSERRRSLRCIRCNRNWKWAREGFRPRCRRKTSATEFLCNAISSSEY